MQFIANTLNGGTSEVLLTLSVVPDMVPSKGDCESPLPIVTWPVLNCDGRGHFDTGWWFALKDAW
jgi:hypothetical protein